MNKYDLAVIGSGMGGALTAALHKNHNHILFEKDKNFGGCASTFKRYGHHYNVGATTLVGYEKNHVLKRQFDSFGFSPNISESKVAIQVIQNRKKLNRTQDMNAFLDELNKIHPHKDNSLFWKTLKHIDEQFWQLQHFYYAKHSFNAYYKSLKSFVELLLCYKKFLFMSASSFITSYLPNISKEYQAFIDAQLLITVQSTSKDISALSMALGLCYPFHKVFYAYGGMGAIINGILKDVNTHNKETIETIIQEQDSYRVITNKDEYKSKNIVLNASIYDSSKLFTQEKFKNYYKQFQFSDQSAFTLYLTIQTQEPFLEHYQIILDNSIPNCVSKSFFISFSKKDDPVMSKNNTYSVTISTHTKALFWDTLNTTEYEMMKEKTQNHIIKEFLANFDTIKKENIMYCMSGTSKTFKRYINRLNCGGRAINLSTLINTPTCTTPFKGLYNIGDTVFAGQGWPGVALGVDILAKELNGKL